jgi:hypothetical protein
LRPRRNTFFNRWALRGAVCYAPTRATAGDRGYGYEARSKYRRRSSDGLGAEEVFEEEAGEAAGLVADDGVFLKKIVEDHAKA